MKCLISSKTDAGFKTEYTNRVSPELSQGQLRINSHFSGINYKDALGVTGTGSIFKIIPIVGGIDVSGEVTESKSSKFKVGDQVLVTGCGLGETHDGGYSTEVIEDESLVVKIPKGLNTREVMIYGTAGFTAALAYHRMVHNGQTPEKGPIVVTGASGGVGQFAVEFFSRNGFEVIAVSSKPTLIDRLRDLGAAKVVSPEEITVSPRPLDKAIYGGVVDNVGGKLLSGLIPHINLWGNVSCVGLASGADLNTTVMPLILRGVSLLGTSSNNTTWDLRLQLWDDLATKLKPRDLSSYVSKTVGLEDVVNSASEMLARKTHGRTLVKIG